MLEWIVSSTVLILGILVLRWVLRGKISLRLQYALWLVVLVRLLCPLNFFQSGLSVQNVLGDVWEQNASNSMPDESERLYDQDEILGQEQAAIPANTVPHASVSGYQSEAHADTPVHDTAENPSYDWSAILGTIWLVGTVVTLSFTFGCNFQFSRMLSRNRTELEVAGASVPVYVSSQVKTPCLVGVFRPVIYLTPQVEEDPTTWNHVIRHEMTHLEHFDHVFSLLRCLALCLHWFNPLVWVAARVSKEDAELACDEGTIARLGEEERVGYGETLIRLTCRSRNPSDLIITATTMIGTHRGIRERIVYLAKKPRTLAYAVAVAVIALGLMVGCTFTGSVEETELSQPEETIPVETTLPEETTPVETTVSVEATMPTVPEETQQVKFPQVPTMDMHPLYNAFTSAGFQHDTGELSYHSSRSPEVCVDNVYFVYTGESNVIELTHMGMTLTLPEEWMDQIAIYLSCAETGTKGVYNNYCYVINRRIHAAYYGQDPERYIGAEPPGGGWSSGIYICLISAQPKSEYHGDPQDSEYAYYLGESDTCYYFVLTPESRKGDLVFAEDELIGRIGEDAYNELVGDLIVTPEMVSEMITIHGQIDSTAEP